MQLDGIPGIIPARWVMPAIPIKYEQIVILNWLLVEVPCKRPMPIIAEMRGWRNREVFDYVRSYDWTARMYERPIKIENVRWKPPH